MRVAILVECQLRGISLVQRLEAKVLEYHLDHARRWIEPLRYSNDCARGTTQRHQIEGHRTSFEA